METFAVRSSSGLRSTFDFLGFSQEISFGDREAGEVPAKVKG